MSQAGVMPAEPPRDCPLCPRLAAARRMNRAAFPEWHNAPVTSFGPATARLLIVGLAPGLRGANRTGRPFTGDYAGDLLYATLQKFGFARGVFRAPRDDERWTGDTLALVDTRVTNAVRCLPPENKPLPTEIRACGRFLAVEIAAQKQLKTIVALGRVAHDAVLRSLAKRPSAYRFAHGAIYALGDDLVLADSFHCSRYNTNTGKLTTAMFEDVFAAVRKRHDRV
jgi:uracil-DNA glycosylase